MANGAALLDTLDKAYTETGSVGQKYPPVFEIRFSMGGGGLPGQENMVETPFWERVGWRKGSLRQEVVSILCLPVFHGNEITATATTCLAWSATRPRSGPCGVRRRPLRPLAPSPARAGRSGAGPERPIGGGS